MNAIELKDVNYRSNAFHCKMSPSMFLKDILQVL